MTVRVSFPDFTSSLAIISSAMARSQAVSRKPARASRRSEGRLRFSRTAISRITPCALRSSGTRARPAVRASPAAHMMPAQPAAAFDPAKAAASTWVCTIARNLRIDAFRRGRRGEPVEDPSEAPEAQATLDRLFAAIRA